MLDKFGFVLKAASDGKDRPVKVTHLGPGRPLGFHFDSKGDLLICNAGTVSNDKRQVISNNLSVKRQSIKELFKWLIQRGRVNSTSEWIIPS